MSGSAPTSVLDALDDAITHYQSQLDRDISHLVTEEVDTPRDYYKEVRGWSNETIEAKRLGWAPASDGALLDYLMRCGHDREAILGTGLFYKGLRPHFRGRPVLPYLDDDGRPAFAIARDIGHPDDHKADEAKYLKAIRQQDYSKVSEPIYGIETIRDGEPLLITEGIADAITAHQADYPCVSPVTTAFKHDDRERLLDLIDVHNVPRVYVIQDAEAPSSDVDEHGRLTIEQFGEGERGGVTTAAYLAENGDIDARIGELPRSGLDKVDLDDYLLGWDSEDGLTPILASAKPAREHPAYGTIPRHEWGGESDTTTIDTEARSGTRTRADSGIVTSARSANQREYTRASRSELFNLALIDVAGVPVGYRGANPLGHHGDSENYFVVIDDRTAHDHKYKSTYTTLTYLLCEANERLADDPNGALSDIEIYLAWRHAKEQGYLPDDDPVPHRGLRGAAEMYDVLDREAFVERETSEGETYLGFPDSETYRSTLDAIAETGLDHGRGTDKRGSESGGEDVIAVVPSSPQARAAANGWRWHTLSEQDDPETAANSTEAAAIAQRELWNGTCEQIEAAIEGCENALIDVIMGGGKTYGAFKVAAERDEPLAYFAPRRELYEQAVEYARENGIPGQDIYTLPSVHSDCSTFRGDHGEEWARRVGRLYALGMKPKAIHSLLEDIPCKHEGKCEYEHKCDFDPDDYQVLIGHYKHAHLPYVTKGRAVVFDEDPTSAFTQRIESAVLRQAVNTFLGFRDSPPFDSWQDLIENRRDPERLAGGLKWYRTANDGEGFNLDEPDERNVLDHEQAGYHAYAPQAVYAILKTTPMADGYPFEEAYLSEMDAGARFFTSSEQEGRQYVEFDFSPNLTYARAVLALDGTPLVDESQEDRPREWERALGRPLKYRRVLSNEERREHLRDRGYVFVQSSPYVRPYSSGKYNDARRDAALLATVRDEYGSGSPPLVFTDKKVEEEYRSGGFLKRGFAEEFDHPGNLRGSNEYAEERLLVRLGSSHHGDHEIRRRAARLGETVPLDPEGKGVDRDYGPTGNAIVRQMRENQLAQDVLRVGRDGKGALVVIDTCAYPNWIPVEDEQIDLALWSKGEQAVHGAWCDLHKNGLRKGAASTAEIAENDAINLSTRHLRRILARFADRGLLTRETDEEDGRITQWSDTGLASLAPEECTEVDIPEIDLDAVVAVRVERANATGTEPRKRGEWEKADISRMSRYTLNVRNSAETSKSSEQPVYAPPLDAFDTAPTPVDGGDPPPDPPG